MKKNIIISVLVLLLLLSWAYIIGSPSQLRGGGWILTNHAAIGIPREGWSLSVYNSVQGLGIHSSGLHPEFDVVLDHTGRARFAFFDRKAEIDYLDEAGDGLVDTMFSNGKAFAMQQPVWVPKEKNK